MLPYKKLTIVGGKVETETIPWIASIQTGDFHFCGASVLSDRWIISAKHCFTQSSDFIVIKTGSLNVDDIEMKTSNIERVYSHPSADVSLLKLKNPLVGVEPISILDGEFPSNLDLKVLGWGLTSENGIPSRTLQSVVVKLQDDDVCANSDSYFDRSIEICAGGVKGEDSCQGDSGGPLVYEKNGKSYLVGVVSRGEGCAREGKYGVYISTLKMKNWILSIVNSQTELSFIDYKTVIDTRESSTTNDGGESSTKVWTIFFWLFIVLLLAFGVVYVLKKYYASQRQETI